MLAFRNLFRHRRRSFLTGLTVLWGCLILTVMLGLTDGTYGRVIDSFAQGWTGHIQLHHKGFNGVCYADTAIPDYAQLAQSIRQDSRVVGVAPRIKVPMFLSAGAKSESVYVIGIDPSAEARTTHLADQVRVGRYLQAQETHSVLLGHALLQHVGAKIGDSIVLLGYGADGSLANGKYTVVGAVDSGDQERDQGYAFLPLQEAMTLVALDDRVQELAVVARPGVDLDELARWLAARVAGQDLRVETWKEFAHGFYRAVQADASTKSLAVVIVSFVVALAVWNTMLMNVLERRREFSLMRALGTSKGFVANMIVAESLLLTLPTAFLGTLVGASVNHWLSIRGIPLAQSLTYGGMRFQALYTAISPRSLYIPIACVFGAALLVALVSCVQALRIAPAAGMRGE